MNEFDECGVFGYCVILEFHFNFFCVSLLTELHYIPFHYITLLTYVGC